MAEKTERKRFRYGEDNRRKQGIPVSNRIFQQTKRKLKLIKPSWDGVKNPLTVRILPALNPDDLDGKPDRCRIGTEPGDFSEFMLCLPCAQYAGTTKRPMTIVLWDPRNHEYMALRENPYVILHRAVSNALDKGEAEARGKRYSTSRWSRLMPPNKRDKPLSRYKRLHYMQGLIYISEEKVYVADGRSPYGASPEDPLPIIQVAETAGRAIASKLDLRNEEYRGDMSVDSQEDAYLYGDITDLKSGRFLTFYNPTNRKHSKKVPKGDPYLDKDDLDEILLRQGLREERQERGDKKEKDEGSFFWQVAMTDKISYESGGQLKTRKTDISKHEEEIRKKLANWDDIIHFPTTDEVAELTALAFSDMPEILKFAWADNPEFFTDDVKGILSSRKSIETTVPDDDEDDDRPRRRRGRDDDDEDDDRGSRRRSRRDDDDDDDRPRSRRSRDDDDQDAEEDDRPRRRRSRDDDDEDDTRSRRRRSREDEDAVDDEDADAPEDDDDGDDPEDAGDDDRRGRRSRALPSDEKAGRRGRTYDDDASDPVDEDEASEDDVDEDKGSTKKDRVAKAKEAAKARSAQRGKSEDIPSNERAAPKKRNKK